MKSATVSALKKELQLKSKTELLQICLHLSKFKKENKELLTYLLFEAENEAHYIESVMEEMDEQFGEINTTGYYYIKKSVRKILRSVKKYIRYSKKKETEAALLLHFCRRLKELSVPYSRNVVLNNIFERQMNMAQKAIYTLHEDLQYDYNKEIVALIG